jgi:hypothetical protein
MSLERHYDKKTVKNPELSVSRLLHGLSITIPPVSGKGSDPIASSGLHHHVCRAENRKRILACI